MKRIVLMTVVVSVLLMGPRCAFGVDPLNLGPEQLVEADGIAIDVGTYSVPTFVDWDNDNLKDLIIGGKDGKVRVYINVGTEPNPQFSSSNSFFAQSNGTDLIRTGSGCMGCFPRVVYWDSDTLKDLLLGRSDGKVEIFLNIGTDENPTFDGGTLLQVGQPGLKANISVGSRATPAVVDWNNDGKKDLAVGAYDAKIHLFINEGTDTEPNFITQTFAQNNDSDLTVPSSRSSPDVLDLDGDGKKDIITGNTNGQLLFYSNTGTDSEPSFSGYVAVEADGVPIDLPSTPRSRPFVCYWTGDGYFGPIDGYLDVLIGAYDGNVHLYQGKPELGDIDKDGVIDFADFALFANQWQQTSCGECGGAELTGDGNVDISDLKEFVENWLFGT